MPPEAGAVRESTAAPPDELYVRVVPALGTPRAALALIHGFAEHGGRYLALAQACSEIGFEVHLLDLRGHGRSPGVRALLHDEDATVAAVTGLLERLQTGRLPVAAFGHSLGGALVLRAAQLRPDLLDAVVASAPFVRSARSDPAWLVAFFSFAARFAPELRTVPIDAQVVSRLPQEVHAYDSDPLVDRGGVRLGSVRVLYGLGPRVLADAGKLVTPTLILHGGADRLADVAASRELYLAAGGDDVELREIPGAAHALLHDRDADRLETGILAWLAERLTATDRVAR